MTFLRVLAQLGSFSDGRDANDTPRAGNDDTDKRRDSQEEPKMAKILEIPTSYGTLERLETLERFETFETFETLERFETLRPSERTERTERPEIRESPTIPSVRTRWAIRARKTDQRRSILASDPFSPRRKLRKTTKNYEKLRNAH